jgi:hypothetical protein
MQTGKNRRKKTKKKPDLRDPKSKIKKRTSCKLQKSGEKSNLLQ